MRDSRTVICTSRFIFVSSDLQKFNLVYIYFVQRTVLEYILNLACASTRSTKKILLEYSCIRADTRVLMGWSCRQVHCTVFLANLNMVSYSTKFNFRWLLAEENWPQRPTSASETRIQSRPCTPFSPGSLYPGMYTKLCTAVPPWNVSKLRGELFNIDKPYKIWLLI